jgi:mono/diheme cytochrome c family protein
MIARPRSRHRSALGPSSSGRLGRRARLGLLGIAALGFTAGCGGERLSPEAERGRQVYLAQCIACHAADPGQAGPVGPPVKGASRVLLEAKILRGTYPPGYTPKRTTSVMPVQPQLAGEIDALAAYLGRP